MGSVNKQILLGRVGKDVDFKTFDGGKMKASLSLATSETYKDRTTGEKKEDTTWHNIVIWGPLAKVAQQYVKKGDMLYVEGKTTNRSYETDKGEKRYVTEVLVSEMSLQGNGKRAEAKEAEESFAGAAEIV
jgi:single-strand DNA-binding protein